VHLYTIDQFREKTSRSLTGDNHDPFDERQGTNGFKLLPHCIYFYYWSWGAGGLPDVRHYIASYDEPIEPGDLDGHARHLCLNARAGNDPWFQREPVGSFQGIEWKRISYLVFAMDSPSWRFLAHSKHGKPLLFDSQGGGKEDNHSFFDGRELEIDVSPTGNGAEKISGVSCINHIKRSENADILGTKPNGDPGPVEHQYYKFSLAFTVSKLTDVVITVDPDGTNTGPPTPPPALSLQLP
jgi:hypothetical protein